MFMKYDPTHLRLVTEPSPALHTRAFEVNVCPPLGDIVMHMFRIMRIHGGVGLAAPQIGLNLRIFVTNFDRPRVFMNPSITRGVCHLDGGPTSINTAADIDIEGCLSIPGRKFSVPRHRHVAIYWADFEGSHLEQFSGHPARVIQHEKDHLDGILISDNNPEHFG
jgi:peptide deformylase